MINLSDGCAAPITRIDAYAYRVPIEAPVATSFGVMRDRPAVFVRIEDRDGCFGWGEVFANWPAAGAEHRVALIERDIAGLVLGQRAAEPEALFHRLSAQTRIRAVQCGEPGPFDQVIAGLDIALWDLVARRAGWPLREMLRKGAPGVVATYASGIAIDAADRLIPAAQEAGFGAFKVKVGFGAGDAQKLLALAASLPSGMVLCADANQAWDLPQARAFVQEVAGAGLGWLEEPLPVFADAEDWATLARAADMPLAGGENIVGQAAFEAALTAGALQVIQPDVVKWGGISGCFAVAKRALAQGRRYCPHFLGGGIGLAASGAVLAAVGGDGMLEVDVNPNPLRSAFGGMGGALGSGEWHASDAPGLGIEALPEGLGRYRTASAECH
ncbi:L-alanine-DL-glutamate epimerase [Roseovarius marisflavi]|uniref:L-alanine-DL-glutamate epimerase n=1 Tax=Roseovarius marisflavi TaxID=1054996 RepID=A0A1M7CXX8_9RHOB|nr:mandelate racemase/muconate lactonizing enzyme family protein [Roseovarius marisflavi]SHL72158.1 L-alanine-DL-glutamate epimerase [Roseovarius marisflavi]